MNIRTLRTTGRACAFAVLAGTAAHAQAASQSRATVRREVVAWTDSVTTNAILWSPAGDTRDMPTLVFSPGFGQKPEHYSVLLQDWASRGYLVVGIEHPFIRDPNNAELYDVSAVVAKQLVNSLGHITRERQRPGSPFARVDVKRIGIIGHSIGGSAAAQTCSVDDRCRAAMNLDGTIFGNVVHTGMKQPFFLLRKYVPPPDMVNDPPRFYEKRDQANMHEDSVFAHTPVMYWLAVEGLDHMSFTDAALAPDAVQSLQERAGLRRSAQVTQEMTTRYVLEFFGAYMSGARRSPILEKSMYDGTQLRFKR